MRYSLFPVMLAASWFWLGGGYDERFCAYADGGAAGYESCSHLTLESCRAYVHGVGGHCRINPRYVEEPARRPKARKRFD